MLFLRNSLNLLFLLSLTSSISIPDIGFSKQKPGSSFESLWFDGSIEDAFAQSQKSKKPVFLYWGAVWCPPCNELKSQVFMKPKFRNLISSVIPVYLDYSGPRF
ncbi:MAG: thioredoxin family protein [Oligoflexales bacterium]|nr:thioredoxin family protein [Oligoflexales bacterium]